MNQKLSTTTPTLGLDDPLTASEAVVEAVADAADVSPLDLDPLAWTVDPDALDSFVDHLSAGTGDDSTVEFAYGGYDVTVHGDASVDLRER